MDPCSHILLYLYFPPLHLLTLAGIRAVVWNHINDTFDGEGRSTDAGQAVTVVQRPIE